MEYLLAGLQKINLKRYSLGLDILETSFQLKNMDF